MKTLCEVLDHPKVRYFFDNVRTSNSGYDSAYEQFCTYTRLVSKTSEEYVKTMQEVGLLAIPK